MVMELKHLTRKVFKFIMKKLKKVSTKRMRFSSQNIHGIICLIIVSYYSITRSLTHVYYSFKFNNFGLGSLKASLNFFNEKSRQLNDQTLVQIVQSATQLFKNGFHHFLMVQIKIFKFYFINQLKCGIFNHRI